MIADNLKLSGALTIDHYDSKMNLIKSHQFNNLVVNAGKNWVISRMINATNPVMTHMALGTNSGVSAHSPVLSDTLLVSQIGLRKVFDDTYPQQTANQVRYRCTFGGDLPSATAQAISEAGLFNADTGGTMLSRVTFGAINKEPADVLIVNWTIILS
jgi:hypothetical protein